MVDHQTPQPESVGRKVLNNEYSGLQMRIASVLWSVGRDSWARLERNEMCLAMVKGNSFTFNMCYELRTEIAML